MEPTTKLSFSLSSKPNPNNNNNKRVPSSSTFSLQETDPSSHEQQQQFVTEFDPSKPPTLINNNTLVIPRLENTWNPYKKMKNIDTPLQNIQDPNLTFELETTPALNMDTDPSMSYGLNIRDKNIKEEEEEEEERGVVSRGGYNPVENVLLKKFKEDMKNLPDDRGMDEFEDVPVEGFGVAILKGYGWKEGQGIGKNAKEDVQVVQYVRRGNKEGLGFQPDKLTFDKKGREQKQLVAPKGENGKTRHVIGIDEKLVVRELKGVHVGKVVRVVSGRHVGLKGKVLDKVDSKVVLKLSSNEEVTVGVQEVAELGTVDDELCVKGLQEEKMRRGGSRDDRRKNERSSYRRSEIRDDKKSDGRKDREEKSINGAGYGPSSKEQERSVAISWLTSHIRVRIISKDYRRGKLYLKKGEVLDVVGPNTCDISLDESKEIIQSVHQDLLETAVPKRGGPVLVLYGKHKGVFGYLVERNMEKETGVVQDADSHELLNVHLEQIAEYLGDPDCIGY